MRPASVPGSTPSAPETVTAIRSSPETLAEEHDLGLGRQVDAGHAARGRALRPHRGGGEAQQLRIARDEDELGVVGRGCRADDRVARLERDDLEVGPHRAAWTATTRLTTPWRVPSASGVSSSNRTSARMRSALSVMPR